MAPKKFYEGWTGRLVDLIDADPPMLDRVTFVNCVLKGPAVLMMQGCTLTDTNLGGPTPDAVLWELPWGRSVVVGAILAKRCIFRKCEFRGVGLAGPPDFIAQIRGVVPLKK